MCVCLRERETERDRDRERGRLTDCQFFFTHKQIDDSLATEGELKFQQNAIPQLNNLLQTYKSSFKKN